ncbi:acyl carrier protein [Streptomyces sp. 4503]|uniref:Acyl carrier protein n=1 Tax=Streptomyces niphimycinicus TaxID=2842201 RepID=A0ABS6CB13_9ACTN|nr:acyl carrier protein [Streptomyces niphimycinicus]MBU3864070.1 acyl carrier protein [Streptomyces niphimycinicus]
MTLNSGNSSSTADRTVIFDEVRKVLVEQCGTPDDIVVNLTEQDLMDELGLDSITLAYVFTYFEQKHDLTFENDDIDPLRYQTVSELIDVLAGRISEAAAEAR